MTSTPGFKEDIYKVTNYNLLTNIRKVIFKKTKGLLSNPSSFFAFDEAGSFCTYFSSITMVSATATVASRTPTNSSKAVSSFTVDPHVGSKAVRYANRVYEEMSKRSTLLKKSQKTDPSSLTLSSLSYDNHSDDVNPESSNISSTFVAPFDRREILPFIGDLLGKGGFNSVFEIERIQIRDISESDDDDDDDVSADEQVKHKKEMIQQNITKMAIKFLSQDAYNSIEDACNGSADLYMEAQYLTALTQNHPHPNIIQIHGISNAGSSGLSRYGGYFIVIDRLYDTLDRRIDIWRELQRRKIKSTDDNDAASMQKYLQVLFIQRLLVTYEIISAVRHLHSLNIIFRDLKPDNIGFDYQNKVKIFDFGLAKELDPKQLVSNSKLALYSMSGGTGSRRFMAPEVALSQPYGLSADLYSFGIVAWEIFALEKAFGQLSVEQHQERVINGTDRPQIPSDWTIGVKEILLGCWDHDTSHRPCAGTVERLIQKEVSNMIAMSFPAQAVANKKAGLK